MTNRMTYIGRKTKELIFIFAAIIFLLIGIVGIVLPLLPTTPFLLLAAYCFNLGSKKFHRWLVTHWLFGPPIQDWEKNKIIHRKTKVLVTVMMAISSVLVLSMNTVPMIGKGVYSVSLILVLVFIWTRRSHN